MYRKQNMITSERRPPATFERGARIRSLEVLVITFSLAGLFLAPLVLRPVDVQTYYLALVLTVLTSLPVVVRIASGTLDILEPIVPISVLIGLAFGVRSMYLAYAPVTLMPLHMGFLRADDFVPSALLLTIAAYFSLLAGYYVVAGPLQLRPIAARRFGRRMWAPGTLKPLTILALLGAAGLATNAERPTNFDAVTIYSPVIAMLASLVQPVACVLALHMAAGDTRLWLRLALWCGALPLSVWQSLAFSAKAPILLLLFSVIGASHYGKRRVSLPLLIASVAVAIVVVFPIVNAFRQPPGRVAAPVSDFPTRAEFIARIVAVPTLFEGMTPPEYLQYAAEGVMARSTGTDSLGLLLRYDVSNELGDPDSYWLIPLYAFVPRIAWPTKPVLDQGPSFGRLLVVPGAEGAGSYASFGIFHIGDLFVSFGVAGVLIGMGILGFLYRLFYRFFDPLHSPDLGVKFVYLFMLWTMVNGFESDIPSVYAHLLKSLVVWFLLKSWLNAPSTGGSTPPRSSVLHPVTARPGIPG